MLKQTYQTGRAYFWEFPLIVIVMRFRIGLRQVISRARNISPWSESHHESDKVSDLKQFKTILRVR